MRGLFLWVNIRLPVSDPDLMRDVADGTDAVAGQNFDVKTSGAQRLNGGASVGAQDVREIETPWFFAVESKP
jgi:hypothetical protein